ncbi:anti-sigma factor antagonist [Streptomyces sp. SID4948]|nr:MULTISPECIES: STAS domain-containing protein [unclassified Streptomyces]MYS20266.1 anti-sigma factor antagonist [Streptomyces sp. SID4948]
MTALILTTRATAEGAVLAVAGDLDHESADRFRAAADTVTLEPGQLLTVDLAALTFCDSTGITALIAARNHTQAQDAGIVLTGVPAATLRILRMLGLDQIFSIHPAPEPG